MIRAALIPAFIYYLALFLIVHFYSQRIGMKEGQAAPQTDPGPSGLTYEGIIFVLTLGSLVGFLLLGYTVFRSVSIAIAVVVGLSFFHPRTRLIWSAIQRVFTRTAKGGVPLVAAAASVGIILGVVTLTGIGTKFPSTILLLAGENLLLALILIMVGSIVYRDPAGADSGGG